MLHFVIILKKSLNQVEYFEIMKKLYKKTKLTHNCFKKVSNVYRYGAWKVQDAATKNSLIDTPYSVWYNDGTYRGKLYRLDSQMEHSIKLNKTRWVTRYSGTVMLVSAHGNLPVVKEATK